MRVRYFHHGLWPSPSPSTTFVTWNCMGFTEIGADYELVTVANSDRAVPEVLATEFGIRQPLRVRLLRAGTFRRSHRVVYLLAFVHFLFSRWDVLITRNLGFLPWAVLLRRLRGGRVLFEAHDFFTDPGLRGNAHGPTARRQEKREQRWIPRVDGVLCVSRTWHELFLARYPGQHILTAVTGVKTPSHPRSPRERPGTLVAFLGTFDPVLYDFDLILTAIRLVRSPGARLVIAGARSGAEVEAMRARAVRCGAADRVEILPWLSYEELEALKARVDVGLSPLAINARNRGGTPLKVLEYLSAGIPVVGSDLPSIRDLLGDIRCGLIADHTAAAWATAIDRVLRDPPFADALSANCLALAKELSWDRRAGRILAFLDEIASGRHPNAALPSRPS